MVMIRYAEFCTGVGGFRLGMQSRSMQMKSMTTVKRLIRKTSGWDLTQKIYTKLFPLPYSISICFAQDFHANHSLRQEKNSDLKIHAEQSFLV